MRYLSVCSGIEAASVAWYPLGWQCAGVAEIARLRSRLALAESAIAEHSEVAYLILILCKIREASGVGMRPMLSELPEAIAAKIEEGKQSS